MNSLRLLSLLIVSFVAFSSACHWGGAPPSRASRISPPSSPNFSPVQSRATPAPAQEPATVKPTPTVEIKRNETTDEKITRFDNAVEDAKKNVSAKNGEFMAAEKQVALVMGELRELNEGKVKNTNEAVVKAMEAEVLKVEALKNAMDDGAKKTATMELEKAKNELTKARKAQAAALNEQHMKKLALLAAEKDLEVKRKALDDAKVDQMKKEEAVKAAKALKEKEEAVVSASNDLENKKKKVSTTEADLKEKERLAAVVQKKYDEQKAIVDALVKGTPEQTKADTDLTNILTKKLTPADTAVIDTKDKDAVIETKDELNADKLAVKNAETKLESTEKEADMAADELKKKEAEAGLTPK